MKTTADHLGKEYLRQSIYLEQSPHNMQVEFFNFVTWAGKKKNLNFIMPRTQVSWKTSQSSKHTIPQPFNKCWNPHISANVENPNHLTNIENFNHLTNAENTIRLTNIEIPTM